MEQARTWLREAQSVCVLTGAGVSAESGIPTFRGEGGLWRRFRAEDLATPEAFATDPKVSWEWYDWRRQVIAKAQPNPGHLALVELENRVPTFTLVTQNVDGLHHRAGSRNIISVHGDIWNVRCLECAYSEKDERAPLPEIPPRCPRCGGLLRPGVVWFGESLPVEPWRAAEAAASKCDVLLVAGTSAVVMPVGGLVGKARQAGARVIEINADQTRISNTVDLSIRGPFGEILPQLLSALPIEHVQETKD
jgi:NAD-dependent deacetylase